MIAKFARFEWEIPRLSQETRACRMLESTGLAPRFLGHINEHGRVIGFVLEKLEGRDADIEVLKACQDSIQRVHDIIFSMGMSTDTTLVFKTIRRNLSTLRTANSGMVATQN